MITKVEIENYKTFEKVSVNLGKFNVFIGPNNSGKTNFIRFLEMIKEFPSERIIDILSKDNAPPQVSFDGKPYIKCLLSIDNVEPLEYSAEIGLAVTDAPRFISEDIIVGNRRVARQSDNIMPTDPNRYMLDGEFGRRDAIRFNSIFANIKPFLGNHVVGSVFKLLSGIHSFSIIPSKCVMPSYYRPNEIPTLGSDGSRLPSILSWYLNMHRPLFDSIEEQLKSYFPDIEHINLIKTDVNNVLGERVCFKMKNSNSNLESSNVSNGIILFLTYLCITNTPLENSLIMIEEPENGVHPKNLKRIVQFLLDFVEKSNVQLIITTHSPDLLDWIGKENVFIFHRENEGPTQITKLIDIPNFEDFSKGYYLGELWTNYWEEGLLRGGIRRED